MLKHPSLLPRTACSLQAYRFLIPSVSCSIGFAVGRLAAKGDVFFSQVPKQTVGPTPPVIIQSMPGSSGPCVKLATYLNLAPRLRKHGVTCPLRHMTSWRCASLCTGTVFFHLHIRRLHRQTEDVPVYLILLFFLHNRKKPLRQRVLPKCRYLTNKLTDRPRLKPRVRLDTRLRGSALNCILVIMWYSFSPLHK